MYTNEERSGSLKAIDRLLLARKKEAKQRTTSVVKGVPMSQRRVLKHQAPAPSNDWRTLLSRSPWAEKIRPKSVLDKDQFQTNQAVKHHNDAEEEAIASQERLLQGDRMIINGYRSNIQLIDEIQKSRMQDKHGFLPMISNTYIRKNFKKLSSRVQNKNQMKA